MLHCIGHMDRPPYKHILQNVMVPSVRMLYHDGIIHFQEDHSSIQHSRVVKEWLSLQADVEFIDWLPRAPDMNPTENTWRELKTMQETSPVLPHINSDELRTLVSDAWDEVASSQRCIRSLIESMTRRMKSVVEAKGFWTSD